MQKQNFPPKFHFPRFDDDLFLSPFHVFSILIIDSHERKSKSLILTFNFFLEARVSKKHLI